MIAKMTTVYVQEASAVQTKKQLPEKDAQASARVLSKSPSARGLDSERADPMSDNTALGTNADASELPLLGPATPASGLDAFSALLARFMTRICSMSSSDRQRARSLSRLFLR